MAKRTSRLGGKRTIRQNRPGWRKEIVGEKQVNRYQKPKKIKGKKYIKVQ